MLKPIFSISSTEILMTLWSFLTRTSAISWCRERVGPLRIKNTNSLLTGCPLDQPGRVLSPLPTPHSPLLPPTYLSGPRLTQEWAEGQPTCPSSRIHHSVTYCRASWWEKLTSGSRGGISGCDECIPLSGQRPSTISSQRRTQWFSLHSFGTFPRGFQTAAETPRSCSQVQTELSCFFAFLLYFILFVWFFLFSYSKN